MPDTTTISVRTDQAQQLKAIMGESGTYKTALDRLLEGYESDAETVDVDADAVADALSERMDTEALYAPGDGEPVDHREVIPSGVNDEQIDDILAGLTDIQQETARMSRSLETVEERTGKIDRSLEELSR